MQIAGGQPARGAVVEGAAGLEQPQQGLRLACGYAVRRRAGEHPAAVPRAVERVEQPGLGCADAGKHECVRRVDTELERGGVAPEAAQRRLEHESHG